LSVAANGWESSKRLTRMCTIPINGVLDAQEGQPPQRFLFFQVNLEPTDGSRH
jgi:hypothetical protein